MAGEGHEIGHWGQDTNVWGLKIGELKDALAHRPFFVVSGLTSAGIANVINTPPAVDAYGLVARIAGNVNTVSLTSIGTSVVKQGERDSTAQEWLVVGQTSANTLFGAGRGAQVGVPALPAIIGVAGGESLLQANAYSPLYLDPSGNLKVRATASGTDITAEATGSSILVSSQKLNTHAVLYAFDSGSPTTVQLVEGDDLSTIPSGFDFGINVKAALYGFTAGSAPAPVLVTGSDPSASANGLVTRSYLYVYNAAGVNSRLLAGTDNSASSSFKIPILPARANRVVPSWTEGNQVPISVDLFGTLRSHVFGTEYSDTPMGITATSAGGLTSIAVATSKGGLVRLATDFGSVFARIKNKQFMDNEEVRYDIPNNLNNAQTYVGLGSSGAETVSLAWHVVRTDFDASGNPSRDRIRFSLAWDARASGWA